MIHSFFISPDGVSRSVYNDELIDMYEDIPHQKRRASNIEFNNDLGLWEAIDSENGKLITRQKKRQDAIKLEIEYLENKFRNSTPESPSLALCP